MRNVSQGRWEQSIVGISSPMTTIPSCSLGCRLQRQPRQQATSGLSNLTEIYTHVRGEAARWMWSGPAVAFPRSRRAILPKIVPSQPGFCTHPISPAQTIQPQAARISFYVVWHFHTGLPWTRLGLSETTGRVFNAGFAYPPLLNLGVRPRGAGECASWVLFWFAARVLCNCIFDLCVFFFVSILKKYQLLWTCS